MSQHHSQAEQSAHVTEAQEEAARAPVAAPEADAVQPARPEPRAPESEIAALPEAPLVPPQHPVVKQPIQSIVPPISNEVSAPQAAVLDPVDEALRAKAEGKLAEYLGHLTAGDTPQLNPKFTEGLKLTLKENIVGQHDGLELCFQGPLLTTGSGLFGEQVVTALKNHPAFAPLFADEKTRPHFMKPREEGKEDMLHVHVNHLSAEQFTALVHRIADGAAIPPLQAEQLLEKATGTAIGAQKKEHANEHPLPMVQAPVAALEKGVANDNDVAAVAGVAR